MSRLAPRRGSGVGVARVISDDHLAQRAARGDNRAFAAIFDRYHQSLYRYCLAIAGDPQDAQDALQNAMVKVLRALPGEERRIELKPWLYRIAHNESIELLRRRHDTRQLDAELAAPGSGLADTAASRERLRRLISDLDELPERQRGALVMRELAGLDFAEIGVALGTSPAVARQTLYEARLSLRQMDEGREMSCETVTKALSDGDGRVTRRRDVRAHLRGCPSCRRFREEIEGRERDFAALSPLPVAAAIGLLQGLLGGNGGGGLAGALGGGAAKSLGASTALKGVATVAVVAALGVGAADRGGLVDVGLPGGGGSTATRAEPDAAGPPAAGQPRAALSPAAGAAVRSRVERRAVGELDDSGAASAGSGKAASPAGGRTNAEASAPTPQDTRIAHPYGRGHVKQHPAASAHGQQTAAAHQPADHGSAGGHPAHPSKPSRPAHPSKPSPEKPPPPTQPAPEASPAGDAATQTADSEEATPAHETGNGP